MACGFPVLLNKPGGCGTRPHKPYTPQGLSGAQTVLAEITQLVCVARHGSRGSKSKPPEDSHCEKPKVTWQSGSYHLQKPYSLGVNIHAPPRGTGYEVI